MKLRLFRPVPVDCWRKALQNARKVVVIDRNMSPGLGGIFASEIRAALYGSVHRPPIYSVIAGLGGRDVTPEDVEGILRHVMAQEAPSDAPLFWGLKK
jgi:pyruvate/2-oxoacid:ferredoxin oxidoreductase alpha subunit